MLLALTSEELMMVYHTKSYSKESNDGEEKAFSAEKPWVILDFFIANINWALWKGKKRDSTKSA